MIYLLKEEMKEKCRICLGERKSLLSIFDSNGPSYSDMMCGIANVKVTKDDGLPDKICRVCRKKLEEAYDFKLTIERVEASLNNLSKNRRITFNNINDIKMEIEIDLDQKPVVKSENYLEMFNNGVNEVSYSNTVIKKIENSYNICLRPIPVLDFLKTMSEEFGDEFYNDFDAHDSDDESSVFNYEDSNDEVDEMMTLSLRKRKTRSNDKSGKHNVCDDEDSDGEVEDMPLSLRKIKNKRKYVDEYYDDEDYVPLSFKKYKYNKSTRKIKTDDKTCYGKENQLTRIYRKHKIVHNVCLKPVYMESLQFVPKSNQGKKYKKQKPQESTICPHCGITTKSLKQHMLIHTGERSFKCDKCSKGFFRETSLQKHKQEKHSKTKDFTCDECVSAFTNKRALESHKIMHSSEFKFVCKVCNKRFKRKAAHRRHELSHNSANKNIKCDLCNMSFFSKYGLQQHLRIHTGERPYNCELCSQPYSYKTDFNRHCLKKHGLFLKRRTVRVMNEEVLQKERALMRDLTLRIQGVIKDDKLTNPFESEGPQAALAFQQAIKAIENRQIPVDF